MEFRSYEELPNALIEMKDSMYRFDFNKVFAYVEYLCGIDMEIYSPEVEILNIEIPKLEALQNECNQILFKNGIFWPNQSHLFTHPFYYIEYDVAQMSVFEFYAHSKQNYQASWNDYNRLCQNGGSKGYRELLVESNLSNPFLEDNVTKICKPVLEEFYSL